MPPALLVLVDGFTRLGGSQYVDSIHNGDYATYTVRDVVGHVDARYRTIAAEGGRAVLGKSSGGFGAMHLVHGASGRLCGVCVAQRRLVLSLRAPAGVRDGAAHARSARLRHRRVRRGVRAQAQAQRRPNTRRWRCWPTRPPTRRAARRRSISICLSIGDRRAASTTSSRAGSPSIRPSAWRAARAELSAPAPALSRLRPARRVQSRHRRARRRRAHPRPRAGRCGTRNSTTTIATSDTGTQFRFRRWPPFWTSE